VPRVVLESTGRVLEAPYNANLRELMLRDDARLYYGAAVLFNCRGRARCGTCAVMVVDGAEALSPKTPAEKLRLGDARPEIRLACQTNVRGDCRIHPGVKK
jgi:ferredoxin